MSDHVIVVEDDAALRVFVADALESRGYAVAPRRLTVDSFGESRPLVQGSSESAWARNRRAEFTVNAGSVATQP